MFLNFVSRQRKDSASAPRHSSPASLSTPPSSANNARRVSTSGRKGRSRSVASDNEDDDAYDDLLFPESPLRTSRQNDVTTPAANETRESLTTHVSPMRPSMTTAPTTNVTPQTKSPNSSLKRKNTSATKTFLQSPNKSGDGKQATTPNVEETSFGSEQPSPKRQGRTNTPSPKAHPNSTKKGKKDMMTNAKENEKTNNSFGEQRGSGTAQQRKKVVKASDKESTKTSTPNPVKKISNIKEMNKKTRKQSPMDQAHELAIQASQMAVDLAEQRWKQKADEVKASLKSIKVKETELERLQEQLRKLKDDYTKLSEGEQLALQQKRAALKSHKVLVKKLEKAQQAVTQVQENNVDLQKKLKQEQKRVKEESVTGKRKRTDKSPDKSKKKKTKKSAADDDDSDSDDSTSDDKARHDVDEMEDDSDFECNVKSTAPASDRCVRRRNQEWECPACTLKNAAHTKKCSVCETAKPGTFQLDDSDDEEEDD